MLLLRGLLDVALATRWRTALAAQTAAAQRLAAFPDWPDLRLALRVLRRPIEERLGAAPQRVASQCWVRRATPPHAWHQDGALHHDFLARPGGTPLPMWTCWIALTDCGLDAPGLEWVAPSPRRLLAPAELSDEAVRRRFAAADFHRPALTAGDALLFDGSLLHRTHVTPSMRQQRTSVELRFIAAGAPPPRLAAETLAPFL